MLHSERLGWFFLLIPLGGYVVATLVTNAFYNRYFIGMLPGVAIAFACALWRHFRQRSSLSMGVILVMSFFGVGHQLSVTARPSSVEPPSNRGDTAACERPSSGKPSPRRMARRALPCRPIS